MCEVACVQDTFDELVLADVRLRRCFLRQGGGLDTVGLVKEEEEFMDFYYGFFCWELERLT